MPELSPCRGSLVLYKNNPARVKSAGKKLEIEVAGGETLKVRPKDMVLLHPGPMQSLDELCPQKGEVEIAWELLSGNTTSLVELAELAYGAYTPATAWAAWQLVADGLYFRGEPQEVIARSPEKVAQEQAARQARIAERRDWAAFLKRVRANEIAPEKDGLYLKEVEELALGRINRSLVLREPTASSRRMEYLLSQLLRGFAYPCGVIGMAIVLEDIRSESGHQLHLFASQQGQSDKLRHIVGQLACKYTSSGFYTARLVRESSLLPERCFVLEPLRFPS